MEIKTLLIDDQKISISIYRSNSIKQIATIIYLHGGGFIFGNRDDLPHYQIEKLLLVGFNIVSIDYLKSPESPLSEILSILIRSNDQIIESLSQWNLSESYFFYGRSAGAYLVLQLCRTRVFSGRKKPKGIIVFYGYTGFEYENFTSCSQYYLRYPIIEYKDIQHLINKFTTISTTFQKRYPIYVYARQTGQWLHLIGINRQNTKDFRVEIDDIKHIPVFLAASTQDNDVSFHHTLEIKQKVLNATLFTSHSEIHEFDQQKSEETEKLMENLVIWLLKYVE